MEQNPAAATLWRMWVDTKRRIVSFHEEKDCQLLEFRSHEMFLNCVDQYACKQYRYQWPCGAFSAISRRLQPPKEAF